MECAGSTTNVENLVATHKDINKVKNSVGSRSNHFYCTGYRQQFAVNENRERSVSRQCEEVCS